MNKNNKRSKLIFGFESAIYVLKLVAETGNSHNQRVKCHFGLTKMVQFHREWIDQPDILDNGSLGKFRDSVSCLN